MPGEQLPLGDSFQAPTTPSARRSGSSLPAESSTSTQKIPPQQGWSCPGFVKGARGAGVSHGSVTTQVDGDIGNVPSPSSAIQIPPTNPRRASLTSRQSLLSVLDTHLSHCSTLASLAARHSSLAARRFPLSLRDARLSHCATLASSGGTMFFSSEGSGWRPKPFLFANRLEKPWAPRAS